MYNMHYIIYIYVSSRGADHARDPRRQPAGRDVAQLAVEGARRQGCNFTKIEIKLGKLTIL